MIKMIKEYFVRQYENLDLVYPWLAPDGRLRTDKKDLADNAERLLSDPMLQSVFETVRNTYRRQWETSERHNDHDKREMAYLSIIALRDVEQAIRMHIHNAKIARNN